METEAAVLWERHADWSVEPIELDPPRDGEVVIRLAASGMCHSDEHLVTGDIPMPLPMIGGHEGAGLVEAVGPGVTAWAGRPRRARLHPGLRNCAGRPPATPTCATWAPCWGGRQMDGTIRHHARGRGVATMMRLGTFAPRRWPTSPRV